MPQPSTNWETARGRPQQPPSPPALSAADAALRKAEWQPWLFASRPLRSRLLALRPSWPRDPVHVRVHRNHAFEPVASVMAPFLAFGGWEPTFAYGDYDDSLGLLLPEGSIADVEVVWLDFGRYRGRFGAAELARWLGQRLARLRALSAAPILVPDWDEPDEPAREFNEALRAVVRAVPGARVCDRSELVAQLGDRYFDERASALSGTRLSDAACVRTARELACRWIPAALRPRLKAIALDLDQTLYHGVLGEDGPGGVVLTPDHAALQRLLLDLRSAGIFLAVVSRNEPEDVRRLFASRPDFPLRWEHLSAHAIGWSAKASGLREVAGALRIGLDALLFVDDNPGELAAVAQECPQARVLHAAGADATARALEFYPGLWSWGAGEADALRVSDLGAAERRARLMAEAPDPGAYLRSLGVRLTFASDAKDQLGRLHELSRKTNQFNLNLSRLGEVELARRIDSDEDRVVSIRLSDRLAESGLIGLVAGRREASELVVDELCISCRALGRDLEDLMIGEAVRRILRDLPADRVVFEHRTGPRNGPARSWLARLLGRRLEGDEGRATAPEAFGRSGPAGGPVEIHEVSAHDA